MTKKQKRRKRDAQKHVTSLMRIMNAHPRRFMDPAGRVPALGPDYENAPYEERIIPLESDK